MRFSVLLPLVLLAGCGAGGDEHRSVAPSEPLSLVRIASETPADCVFAADYGSTPLLLVRHERNRARGEVRPAGRPLIELTGTSADSAALLPQGVQLEGRGLTVSVTPANLPGVPVGAGGVRRPAVLTAATSDGGTTVVEGDWSCRE